MFIFGSVFPRKARSPDLRFKWWRGPSNSHHIHHPLIPLLLKSLSFTDNSRSITLMKILLPELWRQVFLHFSAVDEATNTCPDAWAEIATSNGNHRAALSHTVIKSNQTKRALALVSREFYEFSRPFALEIISLRTIDSLRCLVHRLNEEPWLSSVMSQYTKRIDVNIVVEQNISKRILGDLEVILTSCPNLVYFSCSIIGTPLGTDKAILDILCDTCSSLKVLRCDLTPSAALDLSSVIPKLTKLHVLDFAMRNVEAEENLVSLRPYRMPCLHTLIGPLDIISTRFQHVDLPSFRTMISRPPIKFLADITHFFRIHGAQIKSFSCTNGFLRNHEILSLVPNVTVLVIQPTDEMFCVFFGSRWPNLRTLGVADIPGKDWNACVILFMLCGIDGMGKESGFENLRTLRLIGDRCVRRFYRQVKFVSRLRRDRESMNTHVRVEDEHGNIIA